MFFEAPHVVDDEPERRPAEPTRERDWVAWRNERLARFGADFLRRDDAERERAANPTIEDLHERVAEAREGAKSGEPRMLNNLAAALERLADRDSLDEAVELYERAAAAGSKAAPNNLARLRAQLESDP